MSEGARLIENVGSVIFVPISPKFRQWPGVCWMYALQIVINTQLGVSSLVCDIVINSPLSNLDKSWPCTPIYTMAQKMLPRLRELATVQPL